MLIAVSAFCELDDTMSNAGRTLQFNNSIRKVPVQIIANIQAILLHIETVTVTRAWLRYPASWYRSGSETGVHAENTLRCSLCAA